MHGNHDYALKLMADARANDLHRRALQERLYRELRRRFRRQLALWLCYRLKSTGRYLVSLGERIEGAEHPGIPAPAASSGG